MPSVPLAEGPLNYLLEGPESAPVLVLSNSLGTNLHMWDTQMPEWTRHFRVLRYDTRGHGESLVTPGEYSVEQLGRDVLALLDALQIDKVHFCGLSMGGSIGQWLGVNAGNRLQRLVLCNTAAKIGDAAGWNGRIDTVLSGGQAAMQAMRDAAIGRWFTEDFIRQQPHEASRIADMIAATAPEGYAANCAAVRDADFRDELQRIEAPTLIICGTQDAVTTVEHGRFMEEAILNARRVDFPAAHLSNVEIGTLFTERVRDFLLA